MNRIEGLVFLILLALFVTGCSKNESDRSYPSNTKQANEYVGEAACISCHQAEYNEWRGSHHDWAMKLPNDSTVLGDFNDITFTANEESYLFFKKDSAFYVKADIGGQTITYKIAYTFGVTPLQQYLIKFPGGKYQTLRATWDTEKQVWYNQYPGEVIAPNDWLHWTGGGQRWNTMCAECHSTNLEKNYIANKDQFNTTYDNITVSCEACHGPAATHITWANGETPTGNPSIKVVGSESIEQFNQCAGCHARRVKLTEVMKPGTAFDDQFRLQTISTEFYHADGQIKEEDYVFGSFVQSKMFSKGVKCTDCHNIHSAKLKFEGNALCMQCHTAEYNSPAHHFHEANTESAQCISCHMTGQTYMGNDFRRDHSFRVPRPDQSVDYNTPNACTGCHEDKGDKWAADWIKKWYGDQRADHFSDHLLLASQPSTDEAVRNQVLQFINKMEYPAIARATALEYYPLIGDEADYRMLLKALEDSSALVRVNALGKFQVFPLEQRASIALRHVKDSSRSVRIAAANLIIELDLNQVPPAERGWAIKSREELEVMLRVNADFPLGRLQLGDYYYRQNNINRAMTEYKMAIRMDSLLTPVYSNLATAYSISGDNVSALTTLGQLIDLEPDYARAYYLRGLLYSEMNDTPKAIEDLEKSISLDRQNFRAYYNLANLYFTSEDLHNAEQTMKAGLALEPSSEEGKNLLNIIQSKKSE